MSRWLVVLVSRIVFGVGVVSAAHAGAPPTVVINEVAWMGTGVYHGDEWIELYNWGDGDVDLTGWRLEAEDGKPKIELSGALSSGEHYLLERTNDTTVADIAADLIYTGALGNGGEHLVLKDGADQVMDEVDCSGGWFAGDNDDKATMARIDPEASGSDAENWGTSAEEGSNGADADGSPIVGTPRAANSIRGSGCEAISIADVRGIRQPAEKETEVCIEGCVSVRRGVLGKDIFYVQDDTAGVRVKYAGDLDTNYHKKRLRIEGLRWEAWDEIYVKAETVWILNDDCGRIHSKRVNTGEIKDDGDNYEGLLVDLVGKVVETSGDTFWVDDGSGRVKIYLREETGIEKPTTRVGYQAAIKGIVSQWGSLDSGDPNFRVMPREQGDVEIRQLAEAEGVQEGQVLGVAIEAGLGGVNIGSDPMLLEQLPVTGPSGRWRKTWRLAVAMLCVGLAGRIMTDKRLPHGGNLREVTSGNYVSQVRPWKEV